MLYTIVRTLQNLLAQCSVPELFFTLALRQSMRISISSEVFTAVIIKIVVFWDLT
jgi:hypothetical protein